jgi:uncharacterized membrane protein YraQ (UPF0718 family)
MNVPQKGPLPSRGFLLPGARHSALVFQALFVGAATAMLVFYRSNPSFGTLAITFVSIVLEAIPFMLVGCLIGGLIEVYVPPQRVAAVLPAGKRRSIFLAAALGLVFPVCECAVVPAVRRLLGKGAPLGAGIAFLLGGPIANPVVAASTAVAYGFRWSVVIERMVWGYGIAVAVGFLMDLVFARRGALLTPSGGRRRAVTSEAAGGKHRAALHQAFQHGAEDFIDISRYLIFAAFVTGALQVLVPRQLFLSLADTPLVSTLAMMILAFVLSLCSEADAFVAASFRPLLPLGPQMAFMVLGPMLDVKLLLMYLGLFRRRAIAFLAATTFLLVFLGTALTRGWPW